MGHVVTNPHKGIVSSLRSVIDNFDDYFTRTQYNISAMDGSIRELHSIIVSLQERIDKLEKTLNLETEPNNIK